ncbi:Hypothetical Protein FCC1311_028302 [Hondaea fermentalgiana]|uniref:Uncharacterized protein n=1 Tax=Hondaea fermentalgiana TaxID=2315210 RepID=A0A2R5G8F9_9STRA|nr:Hypothetical Protein FCC1311_028302 [Hondaea fermentalgiana]|eukprot:GBG26609.1 Hypothetical Protein FCC1311_028302 [Hondaea fermentalgiana]
MEPSESASAVSGPDPAQSAQDPAQSVPKPAPKTAAAQRYPFSEEAAKDALAGMLDADLPVSVVQEKTPAATAKTPRRGKKRARAKQKSNKFVFVKLGNLHDKLVDDQGSPTGWQVFIAQDGTTSAHWSNIKKRMGPYYSAMPLEELLVCEDIVPLEHVTGAPPDPSMPFPKAKFLVPRLAQRWRYHVAPEAQGGPAPQEPLVSASQDSSSRQTSTKPRKSPGRPKKQAKKE